MITLKWLIFLITPTQSLSLTALSLSKCRSAQYQSKGMKSNVKC